MKKQINDETMIIQNSPKNRKIKKIKIQYLDGSTTTTIFNGNKMTTITSSQKENK